MRQYTGSMPPESWTSWVGTVLVVPRESDSQWALTTSTARGRGSARAQAASSRIHAVSWNSGGAPWLGYSAGSGPSSGVQARRTPGPATCRRCAAKGC
jgi:hypothetical protein